MDYKFGDDLEGALSYVSVLIKDPKIDISTKPFSSHCPPKITKSPKARPVDRVAARVMKPAWEYHAQDDLFGKPKKQRKQMKKIVVDEGSTQTPGGMARGVKTHKVNGQEMLNLDEVYGFIQGEIERAVNKLCPQYIIKARSAREAVDEAMHGIGGDLELFKKRSKEHIEYLRATRFTYVSEIGNITNALGDVRQFFLDSKHAPEVERLEHFVNLCERLKMLKDSGFLDDVAETMLKLHS